MILISISAHRDAHRVVGGEFEHEFTAGFLLGLIQWPDAAYHLDIALVRRHPLSSAADSPSFPNTSTSTGSFNAVRHIHLKYTFTTK